MVTWNVQRMSLLGRWKRKVKSVAKQAEDRKWEVVLLSEVLAEGEGIVWLGQDESLTAVVHSEKEGILLRGDTLKRWCAGA